MDGAEVVERLRRRFPATANAAKRLALYQRLGHIIETEGEAAYIVVAGAAADAAGKDDPGRYFAYVVTRRLIERGIIETPEL